MQTTIKNNYLSVSINHQGAEVSSIKNTDGIEFIWQGDSLSWARQAPILFPIVGKLKDFSYTHKRSKYTLPQHGFARDKNFFLKSVSDDFVVFYLNSDVDTQAVYPFDFELMVSYGLIKNKLICEYKVTNFGTENMPFSIGAHPGFTCPIVPGEKLEDYKLLFDQKENLPRLLLENGLFNDKTEPFLQNENELMLRADLFNKDAIVIENFKSKSVSLVSQKSNHSVKVSIDGFPYLGIWAKPGAKFVCIEPWFGLADSTSSSGDIENKKGIILLEPKKEFSCSFSMEAN
jgi:galactose mutarotase-like enzyme